MVCKSDVSVMFCVCIYQRL